MLIHVYQNWHYSLQREQRELRFARSPDAGTQSNDTGSSNAKNQTRESADNGKEKTDPKNKQKSAQQTIEGQRNVNHERQVSMLNPRRVLGKEKANSDEAVSDIIDGTTRPSIKKLLKWGPVIAFPAIGLTALTADKIARLIPGINTAYKPVRKKAFEDTNELAAAAASKTLGAGIGWPIGTAGDVVEAVSGKPVIESKKGTFSYIREKLTHAILTPVTLAAKTAKWTGKKLAGFGADFMEAGSSWISKGIKYWGEHPIKGSVMALAIGGGIASVGVGGVAKAAWGALDGFFKWVASWAPTVAPAAADSTLLSVLQSWV